MSALFAHGRIIGWIFAATFLEGAALLVLHHRWGRGVAPGQFLANLASGMSLMLAMWLALAGAWWGFVAAALLAALVFHVIDLARKWR